MQKPSQYKKNAGQTAGTDEYLFNAADHGVFQDDDGTVGGGSATPSQWKVHIHDGFVKEVLASAAEQQERSEAALRARADRVEAWAAHHHCPQCHHPLSATAAGSNNRRVVTLVSLETALNVHIPISTCRMCKTHSHVSPVSIGHFPSTLLQALDLSTAPHNSSLIWFDMQLLDMIVTLQARQFTVPATHLTFSRSLLSRSLPKDVSVP
jgi:hypothetical protein